MYFDYISVMVNLIDRPILYASCLQLNTLFLPTRRYASAVLALAMTFCLSVHLSVTSPCFINTVEQIEFIFSMEAFGGLFIPCVIRKFGYPIIKNNGTPSGTQTLDLENFATARRSLQCVVNLAR